MGAAMHPQRTLKQASQLIQLPCHSNKERSFPFTLCSSNKHSEEHQTQMSYWPRAITLKACSHSQTPLNHSRVDYRGSNPHSTTFTYGRTSFPYTNPQSATENNFTTDIHHSGRRRTIFQNKRHCLHGEDIELGRHSSGRKNLMYNSGYANTPSTSQFQHRRPSFNYSVERRSSSSFDIKKKAGCNIQIANFPLHKPLQNHSLIIPNSPILKCSNERRYQLQPRDRVSISGIRVQLPDKVNAVNRLSELNYHMHGAKLPKRVENFKAENNKIFVPLPGCRAPVNWTGSQDCDKPVKRREDFRQKQINETTDSPEIVLCSTDQKRSQQGVTLYPPSQAQNSMKKSGSRKLKVVSQNPDLGGSCDPDADFNQVRNIQSYEAKGEPNFLKVNEGLKDDDLASSEVRVIRKAEDLHLQQKYKVLQKKSSGEDESEGKDLDEDKEAYKKQDYF